jgi:hypothetical protein
MSIAERWARTPEQIDLMHTARSQGGLCGWCGRQLDPAETVYVERFLTGVKQPIWHGVAAHRSITTAPVCAECASPELLEQTAGQSPESCAWCGRGVFFGQALTLRKRPTCARYCANRVTQTLQASRRKGVAVT